MHTGTRTRAACAWTPALARTRANTLPRTRAVRDAWTTVRETPDKVYAAVREAIERGRRAITNKPAHLTAVFSPVGTYAVRGSNRVAAAGASIALLASVAVALAVHCVAAVVPWPLVLFLTRALRQHWERQRVQHALTAFSPTGVMAYVAFARTVTCELRKLARHTFFTAQAVAHALARAAGVSSDLSAPLHMGTVRAEVAALLLLLSDASAGAGASASVHAACTLCVRCLR